MSNRTTYSDGRLTARPGRSASPSPGEATVPGAVVFVPTSIAPDRPAPLLVMLHGAGGQSADSVNLLGREAEARGIIIIAPKSRGATWDVIQGGFGGDVRAIDHALDVVFERFSVDPRRIAVGGFSDGASYAITLGLTNGDLFQAVLAFSPGFSAATQVVGQPRVYISHGRSDGVLPFSRTGEPLARQLTAAGFKVRFDVFEGGHTVPANKVTAALDWWLAG